MSNAKDESSNTAAETPRRASVAPHVQAEISALLQRDKTLSAAVQDASNPTDSVAGNTGTDSAAIPVKKASEPKVFAPQSAIIAAAIKAATSPKVRRDLAGKRAVAFVIEVPSTSWLKPVESYVEKKYGTLFVIARDGSDRARNAPDAGNDQVAKILSRGRPVVGIAVNPATTLPSSLVSTADHTIKLAPPNGQVVREAMRKCFGRGVPDVIPDALVGGLDLDDLVAVMRKGSRPAEVFTRLHKVSRFRNNVDAGERLPRLEDAIEYGAARTWGLELAKDFSDYNLGLCKWRDISRGAVLHSSPGLGKSMFAKMLAQACSVPIVITSIPELFATSAGFLDFVIKAQRKVYERCSSISPCILFWDELDALPNRATLSPRGRDWWLPVIEDFMLLLDSAVSQREGICVLGATNRLEGIDAAIMRPGRLERAIEIPHPDQAGIANILRFHLDQSLLGVDLTGIAAMLKGSTGADIMMVARDARRIARHAGRAMTEDDLVKAIVSPETMPPLALHRVTIHEAAHAVSAIINGLRVSFCRVQSGAGEAGRTVISSDSEDYDTAEDIEGRVVGILAGRVAEQILIGAVSDGGASDLKGATSRIAAMHISHGLGGQLVYLGHETEVLRQVRRDPKLRETVEDHLRKLQRRAEALVRQHRPAIIAVASELATKRFLTGKAVETIMANFPAAWPSPSSTVAKSARR